MSHAPAYIQLAEQLRTRIDTGDLPPGAALPTQAQLMAHYGLSSTTVREAIDVLRGEGLIETVRGKGTFVREPPIIRRLSSERYAAQLEAIAAGKTNYESAFTRDHDIPWEQYSVDCDFAETTAAGTVATLLQVQPGTAVFERRMILRAAGQADQIRSAWYPLNLVAGTDMTDPSKQPAPGGVIAELAAVGVTITAVDEDVAARMPSPDEAYTLRIPGGVPVFAVTRVGWGVTGTKSRRAAAHPVEVANIVHAADRIVLHYRLEL